MAQAKAVNRQFQDIVAPDAAPAAAATGPRGQAASFPQSRPQLPGLNGVRFLAATAVICHHIEQIKQMLGYPNSWGDCIFRIGKNGVVCFFVLSGFLITYLLLSEKQQSGTIQFKRFYLHRALRIMPLYYFLTVLGFFIIPNIPFMTVPLSVPVVGELFLPKLLLFTFMSAHISEMLHPRVLYAGVLWSTGVEEHFYLLWPVLLRHVRRSLPAVLIGIVAVNVLTANCHWLCTFGSCSPGQQSALDLVSLYMQFFRVDCMAIGGLGAWIVLNRPTWLKWFFSRVTQLATLALLAYALYQPVIFTYVNEEFYSLLFAVLLMNIAFNQKSLLKLENKLCNFMGKISYGLYAYNWIALVIVMRLCGEHGLIRGGDLSLTNWLLYPSCMAATVLLATVSYYGLERPFVRLKSRIT